MTAHLYDIAISIGTLLTGVIIGWVLCNHFNHPRRDPRTGRYTR